MWPLLFFCFLICQKPSLVWEKVVYCLCWNFFAESDGLGQNLYCFFFQRAVPKTFDKSMENLAGKIEAKQDAIKEAEKKFKSAKKAYKNGGSQAEKSNLEKAKKTIERLMEQLEKLEIQRTDKDENKTIALGTSKLNYLDPRISVAWCKKHEVPIEKVYNKTQREKFRWAIDMIMNTEEEYVF